MTPDREHHLEEIFNAARVLPAPERAALLERLCGSDAELRQRAESLLAAHEQAGAFLQRTVALPTSNATLEKPGDRIGRYKLLEQIGEGGFGAVWMAEQEEPVRRRVALKIIKLGMDTKEVVARFEAERQALAMMDHPNIASVFDGGATAAGRPYFVMELVKGIPITDYCDVNKLSTRERLVLFMQVCQAVQHAHQKGIIHRDLKPSNVLVTVLDDRPVPKVIDFGIAKATQARLTEKTLFTRFQQWIGTPAYMSPEQAGLGSLDVDTRSDVYSLGVMLYELLTGRTPFDAQKLFEAGYDAVMRAIREDDPPKPSTRLSTLSAEELNAVAVRRRAEPRKLGRVMRGDLDWLVMKALEKDRRRRYETANALARDIEHYLNSEPISAVAPSAAYRFRKMVLRNRGAFAAAAVVLATLVVGLASSLRLYLLERDAARRATAAEQATRSALAETRTERDRAARLLSLSQAERGVRLLEQDDPSGLLHLVEARKTADPLPDERAARTVLWRGWMDSWPTSTWRAFPGTAALHTVAFSSDSRWLVAGRTVAGATVREVASGRTVATIASSRIGKAELSAEGRFLLVHAGATKELWELDLTPAAKPPRKLMSITMVSPGGSDIVMSPGGDWIFGGPKKQPGATSSKAGEEFVLWNGRDGQSQTIQFSARDNVWDSASQQFRLRDPGAPPPTGRMALSADGKLLAGYVAGALRLWDLPAGRVREKPLRQPKPGQFAYIERLLFSRDSGRLYEHQSGKLQLFDVTNAKPIATVTPSLMPASLLSRNGRWLGMADENGLRILQGQTGELLGKPLQPENKVRVDALAFSPDETQVAAGGRDGTIRLWDVATGRPLEQVHKHPSRITALAFSDDGRWLAATTQDGTAHLHLMTPKLRVPLWEGTNLAFFAATEGRLLAQSLTNGTILSFDLRTGQPVGPRWPGPPELPGVAGADSLWRSGVLSPDGRLLAIQLLSGRGQGQIQFWDASTGRPAGDSIGVTNAFSLEFSRDGKLLAGLAGDGSVQLWNVATRLPQSRLALPKRWEVSWMGLRFSPNAQYLATHSGFGSLHVWDVAAGRLLDPAVGDVWLAISPDWQLAFGAQAGLVDFRDPRQPRPRQSITSDPFAGPAEFSPDGKLLAIAMGDNSVQFWSLATGQRAGSPMKTAAHVTSMKFSADGRLLITAESESRSPGTNSLVRGTVRIWDTATALSCGRPIPAEAHFIFMAFHLSLDSRYLCLPTLKTGPGAADQPYYVLQVWPLPTADAPVADMQRRTESTTGMRFTSAGNIEAADMMPSESK